MLQRGRRTLCTECKLQGACWPRWPAHQRATAAKLYSFKLSKRSALHSGCDSAGGLSRFVTLFLLLLLLLLVQGLHAQGAVCQPQLWLQLDAQG
jgi:hypothetical protein